MRTFFFFIVLAFVFSIGSQPVTAQQAGKVYRVGRLGGGFSQTNSFNPLRRELAALGYVEGKNIIFETRHAEEKPERLPALAAELVRLKVDVIIAGGQNDAITAKKATQTIPIVFTDTASDPVALGLVSSLARPGGNITGFSSMADVLAGKRLEVLKESIPNLSRVAVLWYPSSRGSELQWSESQGAARQLGLEIYSMAIAKSDDYESAFKQAIQSERTALAVTRHRLSVATDRNRIISLAAKYRLPAIYFRGDIVEQGGLMSYGADDAEPFKRVAVMIDKILKGTKPADIPVERSTKFDFVVNLKTAKTLNLTIPPEVLARATKIIR